MKKLSADRKPILYETNDIELEESSRPKGNTGDGIQSTV